jgi:FkbM family methyltransferase
MNHIRPRLASIARGAGVLLFQHPFTSASEMRQYCKVATTLRTHIKHPPVTFHPACLGGNPVLCRPGTTDRVSLADLLFHHYYLPPIPLCKPRYIVDLGSNIGYTVAHFAYLYPDARVIGLELDRANFEMAVINTTWCKERTALLNAAIWPTDGYVQFDGHEEDAYRVASMVGAPEASMLDRTVQARSMESIIEEFKIDRISYLKIDIEGGETELLLDSHASWLDIVDTLKIEIHGTNYAAFHETLGRHGFRCHKDRRHWSCMAAIRA